MQLISSSFENNGVIPKKFGYKNGNISPSLKINNIPQSTKSLVLIMDDPDAFQAVGKIWVHWIVYNILPTNPIFNENSCPSESFLGKNDFGEMGYGGPAPPDKEHTYFFKLYALDQKLQFNDKPNKIEIEKMMKGHILDEVILCGRYSPD